MYSIEQLLYRLAIGQITDDERAWLDRWARGDEARRLLVRRLADRRHVGREMELFAGVNYRRPQADMEARIKAELRTGSRRRRIMAAAAAVAVLLCVGAAVYFVSGPDSGLSEPAHVLTASSGVPASLEDIRPGSTRAMLISDLGESLELTPADSVPVTLLTRAAEAGNRRELCLDVPRGAEFKVILEDSTEVWLNAESTLRYPETFDEHERRVILSGEAYFAVRHDERRPFYVETAEQTIRVCGTEFNVRVYDDDPYVYTTLENGSVSICRCDGQGGEVMLSPGRQARLDRGKLELSLCSVNTEEVTAWKNRRFVFEDRPLADIMRDLSRWYDFEYEFATPGTAAIMFKGSVPRYVDFSTVATLIEYSGGIRLKIENGKVIISG